jgi:predicted nucleotidyltransferase
MNNKIAQMLKQLKEKIVSQFSAGIVNIIVYGSYAREEESEEIIEKGEFA